MAEPMKLMKIILWGCDDLMSKAIELFLATRSEWEVFRFSENDDVDFQLREIAILNPHVFIVSQEDNKNQTRLLLQIMQCHPDLKIIMVNPENNSIEVFNKHKVWVKEVSDLLSVIESR